MELTERVQTALQASVVFLDIVGYSLHEVAEQYQVKKLFNADVAYALAPFAQEGRLLLDTGDGAALCFFEAPRDALVCTNRLMARFASEAAARAVSFAVRTGINIGAVRVIRDMNGQLNVIGDAINDGQRIMSFAETGQVLVSQAFYSAVQDASVAPDANFRYVGVQTDKHGKNHVLYELCVETTQAGGTQLVRTRTTAAKSSTQTSSGQPSTPMTDRSSASLPSQSVARPDVGRDENAVRSRGVLSTVRAQLERFLGRSAEDLMLDAAANAGDIDTLYERLAPHLATDRDRASFLAGKEVIQRMLGQPASVRPAGSSIAMSSRSAVPQAWTPTRELLDETTTRLARYVGTTASALVSREASRATSESDLVLRLAAELKSDEDQISFMADVRTSMSRRV